MEKKVDDYTQQKENGIGEHLQKEHQQKEHQQKEHQQKEHQQKEHQQKEHPQKENPQKEHPQKEERIKEKVVYKVVPVPYYYPVPVDAEWYHKNCDPSMRNGERGGYPGYHDDPAFDHLPFPPSLHGFPAPPRSRDFHYYSGSGREEGDRYWRPVSPLYRNLSPSRSDFSPPISEREISKKQPRENGEERNHRNSKEAKEKHENESDCIVDEPHSVKSEGNESELSSDGNNVTNNDDKEEDTIKNKDDNETNRKRKRYMMTFPYDQRKKLKDGEHEMKEEKNNNNDSVEDLSTNDQLEHKRTLSSVKAENDEEERGRGYSKLNKTYSNSNGSSNHYPYVVMPMRSPPYMGGGEVGRSRYSSERSHSMFEGRHYDESYKDQDLSPRNSDDLSDDKREIRYHPNGRRARTVFTRQQLLTLNNVFEKHPFVSGERMSELSDQLGLDRKIVKIWFQNKRQYARKKGSLVERNDEFYYDYQERYNPSSAPPTMAERWKNEN